MTHTIYPLPNFQVKCHRSHSNLTRDRNDRYLASDFDVLLCNVSNALFRSSVQHGLPLISDGESINWLKDHYKVETDAELIRAAYDDWRICFPQDIADSNGVIPRTPRVLMVDDPVWVFEDGLTPYLWLQDGGVGRVGGQPLQILNWQLHQAF